MPLFSLTHLLTLEGSRICFVHTRQNTAKLRAPKEEIPMQDLKAESLNFIKRKASDHDFARSIVALQLACGIDLMQARSACSEKRAKILVKVVVALKKERQKGLSRHWSYDLNRHIALKQVLDFVRNG